MHRTTSFSLFALLIITGDAHAQSVICPKPERIEHTSSADGLHNYTATAPNGATWQGSNKPSSQDSQDSQERYTFSGAHIENDKIFCRYDAASGDSAPPLELHLNISETVTPANANYWHDGQCTSHKPTHCAFNAP